MLCIIIQHSRMCDSKTVPDEEKMTSIWISNLVMIRRRFGFAEIWNFLPNSIISLGKIWNCWWKFENISALPFDEHTQHSKLNLSWIWMELEILQKKKWENFISHHKTPTSRVHPFISLLIHGYSQLEKNQYTVQQSTISCTKRNQFYSRIMLHVNVIYIMWNTFKFQVENQIRFGRRVESSVMRIEEESSMWWTVNTRV